jgi:hypothetical protein
MFSSVCEHLKSAVAVGTRCPRKSHCPSLEGRRTADSQHWCLLRHGHVIFPAAALPRCPLLLCASRWRIIQEGTSTAAGDVHVVAWHKERYITMKHRSRGQQLLLLWAHLPAQPASCFQPSQHLLLALMHSCMSLHGTRNDTYDRT